MASSFSSAPELPDLRFSGAFYNSVRLFIYYAEVPFPLVIDVLDASVGLPTLLLFFNNEISDKETYCWNASSSSTRHFYTIG